jgi:probable HAF family extracellular repeat protein
MNLPSNASASVTVSGPNGYSTQLTSSQTLQLTPGTYTVTANSVGVGSSTYYPAVASQTATIAISTPASVTVNYSTIIPNTTKALDSAGMSSLTVSPDGSTLTMATSSAVATSLQVGDILASAPTSPAAPHGLLVTILTVSTSGGQVTATTAPATLAAAIQQADMQFTAALSSASIVSAKPLRKGVTIHKGPFQTKRKGPASRPRKFSGTSGSGVCSGSQVAVTEMKDVEIVPNLDVNGTIELCGDLGFQVNFDWLAFQVSSLTATVTLAEQTELTVTDTAAVGAVGQTVQIADIKFGDIVIPVGPIPVDVVPEIVLQVGVNGTIGASLYADVMQNASVIGGFSFSNGQVTPIFPPPTVTFQSSVGTDAGLTATASIEADMTLLFYDVAGPYFDPQAYLQLDVTPQQNPWWTLSGGLQGPTGLQFDPELKILGFKNLPNISFPDLFDYTQVIASATGGFAPAPQLNAVSPNTATAGSPGLSLTMTGTNFVPGAVANFNGSPLVTTFVNSTSSCTTSAPCLTATLPAGDLATAGSFPITVSNPDTSGSTSGPATFTVAGSSVTVSISPTSANVPVGTGQQFTAAVQGTSNTAVTWSVNGVAGGNTTLGTITQQGFYTAPSTVPSPPTVTVTATSQASPSMSASATLTVTTLTYNYATINDPIGPDTSAAGINNGGQIVGYYGCFNCSPTGFLYTSGTFSSISDPNVGTGCECEGTVADGINDGGQIVGGYNDSSQVLHGFLYTGGTYTSIDYPGASGTDALNINNSGAIVGYYVDSSNVYHGYLYAMGTFSSIDYPGATGTYALGSNNSDAIVGFYLDQQSNEHGFLYSGGTFSSIDYPGAVGVTAAVGINDNGQIVGFYSDQVAEHGFLYSDGTFSSINYPNAQGGAASDINNSGQIVGYYTVAGQVNQFSGFLATPAQ